MFPTRFDSSQCWIYLNLQWQFEFSHFNLIALRLLVTGGELDGVPPSVGEWNTPTTTAEKKQLALIGRIRSKREERRFNSNVKKKVQQFGTNPPRLSRIFLSFYDTFCTQIRWNEPLFYNIQYSVLLQEIIP